MTKKRLPPIDVAKLPRTGRGLQKVFAYAAPRPRDSGTAGGNGPAIVRNDAGQPIATVLPWAEFVRLADDALLEHLSDEDFAAVAALRHADGGETVPAHVVNRLIAGENPLKVWREHRGMSQKALAEAVGTTGVYISQIETGIRNASAKLRARLAEALSVDLDDLDPVESDEVTLG